MSAEGPGSRSSILVVDDNRDLVRVITLNLELEGYEVMAAYDGAEALRLIEERPPDLILLDIMMPVMDGWEVLRRLRGDPHTADIPVVIVTARTSDVDKIKGYSGGALEYVTKPFDPVRLLELVRRTLRPGAREEGDARRGERVEQLRLAALYDVARAVSGTLELREVLDIIVDRLLRLFGLSVCGISLLSREGDRLRFAAARSLDPAIQEEMGFFRVTMEGLGGEVLDRLRGGERRIRLRNPRPALAEPSDLISSLENIHIFPLKVRGELIGALVLTRNSPLELDEEEVDLLEAVCTQAAMAIENSRLFEDLRRQHLAHRELLHRAVTAQERERARLARELHDGVIQGLVGSLYRLQFAMGDPEGLSQKAREALEEARGVLDASIEEIRRLVEGLRPQLLDELGLARALQRYALSLAKPEGMEVELRLDAGLPPLLPEAESGIYRIAQEGINNMFKHSGCRRGEVSLSLEGGRLMLSVRDDGAGFDPDEVMAEPGGALGLAGMRERAEYMGGELRVESSPGKGTSITLGVPLEKITGRTDGTHKGAHSG